MHDEYVQVLWFTHTMKNQVIMSLLPLVCIAVSVSWWEGERESEKKQGGGEIPTDRWTVQTGMQIDRQVKTRTNREQCQDLVKTPTASVWSFRAVIMKLCSCSNSLGAAVCSLPEMHSWDRLWHFFLSWFFVFFFGRFGSWKSCLKSWSSILLIC